MRGFSGMGFPPYEGRVNTWGIVQNGVLCYSKNMIRVDAEGTTGKELEKVVDEDLLKFGKWFESKGNEPLTRPEFAIIKTWIWFKLHENSETG
jgi:hypothetical protein